MKGDVVNLGCVRNLWCLIYSKHNFICSSITKCFLTWTQPGAPALFASLQDAYVNTNQCTAVPEKDQFLRDCYMWAWLCRCRKKAHAWDPRWMFPKHWETCALDIEECSGTVYLPAASHKFQINSINSTSHFMVRYFCETWKLKRPRDNWGFKVSR